MRFILALLCLFLMSETALSLESNFQGFSSLFGKKSKVWFVVCKESDHFKSITFWTPENNRDGWAADIVFASGEEAKLEITHSANAFTRVDETRGEGPVFGAAFNTVYSNGIESVGIKSIGPIRSLVKTDELITFSMTAESYYVNNGFSIETERFILERVFDAKPVECDVEARISKES